MRSLARWCVDHRRLVLAGWVGGLVALTVLSQSAGTAYKDSFSLKGTQSFEALSLLEKSAPKASGDVEHVVLAVTHGRLTDAAVRARAQAVLARVAALPDVASVAMVAKYAHLFANPFRVFEVHPLERVPVVWSKKAASTSPPWVLTTYRRDSSGLNQMFAELLS